MSVAHWQRIAADYSLQKKNPKNRTVQGIIAAWNARRASKVKQNKKNFCLATIFHQLD
jgi:hypothetical protein